MTERVLHGIVVGKTIELSEDPGLATGQQIEVVVRSAAQQGTWGEGLRLCAGALANEWSPRDDEILEAIHREREHDSRAEPAP